MVNSWLRHSLLPPLQGPGGFTVPATSQHSLCYCISADDHCPASKVRAGRWPQCDPVSSHTDCLKSAPGSASCTTDYLMSSSTGHFFQERVFFRSQCPWQDTVTVTPMGEPCWVNTELGAGKDLQRCPEQFSQALPTRGEEMRVAFSVEHPACVAHGRAERHH